MATTTPREFTNEPTLTAEKIEHIKDWYTRALGDSDKAGDVEDGAYYQGCVEAFESVLALLHDEPLINPTLDPALNKEDPK